MNSEKTQGFIRKLNFKRTWGILADDDEKEYYFEMKDINQDAFQIREGLSVKFNSIKEETPKANTSLKAIEIEVTE